MTAVRVSVCAGSRRVDVTLPASVPVAELVPAVARLLGRTDGAPRLSTLDGCALDLDAGLVAHGVEDGQVLLLDDGEVAPPVVHDDLAEALAEVVGEVVGEQDAGRRRLQPLGVVLGVSAFAALAMTWSPPSTLAVALTVVLGVVALLSGVAPTLGLLAARITPPWPDEPPTAVDLHRLARDVDLALRVLRVVVAVTGLLPGLVAPVVVRLGPAAAAVCLVSVALMLLRSRRFRSPAVADTARVCGLASLASLVLAAVASHESWRPAVAVALVTAGLAVLLAPHVRTSRVADLLETGCVLAVPPLLLLASGVLDRVPG